MLPPELIAFCAVAAVLVVTPGPDMALVARNALVGGRTAVPITVLGICAGIVVHALAAAIGLSALLKASATAYAVVKIAGGMYLAYLGVQAWRASYSAEGADEDWMLGPARRLVGTVTRPSGDFDGAAAFRQGFVSNVLNPKLVVFFISVLPGFTGADGSFFLQVLVLGIAFEALTAIWLLSYGNGVARVGEAMRAPWIRHLLERISGTVLIALGLKIAWDGSREL
jgi:threonine/homoserine/homoserine lactone efflux protein